MDRAWHCDSPEATCIATASNGVWRDGVLPLPWSAQPLNRARRALRTAEASAVERAVAAVAATVARPIAQAESTLRQSRARLRINARLLSPTVRSRVGGGGGTPLASHASSAGSPLARSLGLREMGLQDDGLRYCHAPRYGRLARIQARLCGSGPAETHAEVPSLNGGAFDGALAGAVRSGNLSLEALITFTAIADAAGAIEGAAALGELVSAGAAAAPTATRWVLTRDSQAVEATREFAKRIVAADGICVISRALRTASSAQCTARGLWALEALVRTTCDSGGDSQQLAVHALTCEKWPRLARSIRTLYSENAAVARALMDMEMAWLVAKGWPRAAAALKIRVSRTPFPEITSSCFRAAARATVHTGSQRGATFDWGDDELLSVTNTSLGKSRQRSALLTTPQAQRSQRGLPRQPSEDWWGTMSPRK